MNYVEERRRATQYNGMAYTQIVAENPRVSLPPQSLVYC